MQPQRQALKTFLTALITHIPFSSNTAEILIIGI